MTGHDETRASSSLRILIADCVPSAMQKEFGRFGGQTNAELFEPALRLHQPDLHCASVNIADGDTLPQGMPIETFDGVILTGSPLRAYDNTPAVRSQIDFARAAFAAKRPVWGSCWGVQLATVALGGVVRRNPKGRGLGIARRISPTRAGQSHWLLEGRPPSFDALCSHLDEVETLPPGASLLATSSFCEVQAMTAQTPEGGSFVGTQYHPEHIFATSAALIEMRAKALVAEGLGRDEADLRALADDLRALGADPGRRDLAWRYGVDAEILDPVRRTNELGQWLRCGIPRQ
jgi:GMP synthase (glutamine-hydrolysing)